MNQKIKPTYTTQAQAIWLKDIGFDVPCDMCLCDGELPLDKTPLPFNAGDKIKHVNSEHPYYSAPEQHQVVEWLRLNHGIWVYPQITGNSITQYYIPMIVPKLNPNNTIQLTKLNSPQEAYSAAFDYIKNNNLI
jgi:hypothetical protein